MNKLVDVLVFLTNCISLSFWARNNQIQNDIFYVGGISNIFLCFNKEYIALEGDSFYSIHNEEFEEIGWLINYNDINKWKEFDKDENIVYALSMENAVERNTTLENLKDRYELFIKKSDNQTLPIAKFSAIYVAKE